MNTPAQRHGWLQDDGIIDEIAIERAMSGRAVRLSIVERRVAVDRLRVQGLTIAETATRLRVTPRTIHRDRYEIAAALVASVEAGHVSWT